MSVRPADPPQAQVASPGVLVYGDLVTGPAGRGVPWVSGGVDLGTGVDCKGLAYHALLRAFPGFPAPAVLGLTSAGDADGGRGAWDAYVAAMEGSWERVPAADRLGDLVRSRASEPPHGPHLSVLVDVPGRLVLTTDRRHGARVTPLRAVRDVVEVLRYTGDGGSRGAAVVG